jgi:hypothetical protein
MLDGGRVFSFALPHTLVLCIYLIVELRIFCVVLYGILNALFGKSTSVLIEGKCLDCKSPQADTDHLDH